MTRSLIVANLSIAKFDAVNMFKDAFTNASIFSYSGFRTHEVQIQSELKTLKSLFPIPYSLTLFCHCLKYVSVR
ncbi:hypothetical protein IQ255_06465 [Pleurocapsales cyanobacterium LEGE 10410]|nr:hypothetical protein [Pleurocapsales cyanobacterium LEGE 10410]